MGNSTDFEVKEKEIRDRMIRNFKMLSKTLRSDSTAKILKTNYKFSTVMGDGSLRDKKHLHSKDIY